MLEGTRCMSNNIYFLDFETRQRNTAGFKAPQDISLICESLGYQRISVPKYGGPEILILRRVCQFRLFQSVWNPLRRHIPKNAIIIYQHPNAFGVSLLLIRLLKSRKKAKMVGIIHDLESLRKGIDGVVKNKKLRSLAEDSVLLQQMDVIICHNEKMRQHLISQGFDPGRLINLELFDYLSSTQRIQPVKEPVPSIAIAGNLAPGKCRYIYELQQNGMNAGLCVHLYGSGFRDELATDGMVWHGSFPPEELPQHLQGDFGLVWDGSSAETCTGNTGAYLKYNNPHKTSLYLAAGMPVIVWRQAAIADFVLQNKIGIVVDSLFEVEDAISRISEKDYAELCRNASLVSQKLREGYYFKTAMEKALRLLET